MANFPKGISTGSEGTAKAKSSSGGRSFQTKFFWKDGEKRYLQFVTDWNDVPAIPMHVVKGAGKFMENFVAPKAWHGEDADDALLDLGWEPSMKQVAVAVEVEPVMGKVGGRSVPVSWVPATRSYKRKDGTEVEEPNVGVIINTPTLFVHVQNYFEDNGTILDTVFRITRNGGDQNTSYTVTPQKGEIVDFTDEILNKIDLGEYLGGLADSAAIRAMVESLPEDHEYNFSKRNKTSKPAPKAQVEPDWDDEDEEPVDEAAAKQSKFDQMKATMS